MDRKTKFNIWYIVVALMGFMLIQTFYQSSKQYTTIPYSQFQTLLDQDKIDKVWIEQNTIEGTLKQPEKDGLKQFVTTRVTPDLASELNKHHVTYTGEIPSTLLTDLLSWVLPAVIFFGLWMFVIRRFGQGAGGLMAIGKSRAKIYVETDTKVPFADVEGLPDRGQQLVAVVADVPREHPPVRRRGAGQRGQLGVVGVARRGVHQPRGQPQRAVLERLGQQLAHAGPLVGARRPVGEPDDPGAQRDVPGERGDVDARPGVAHRVQVPPKVTPGPRDVRVEIEVADRLADAVDPAVPPAAGDAVEPGRERGDAQPAVADDLGGDALVDLAARLRAGEHGQVGMGMDVDEAGAHDTSRYGLGVRVGDGGDVPVADEDIGAPGRLAGPVHDQPAREQHVHPQLAMPSCRRPCRTRPAASRVESMSCSVCAPEM